MAGTELVRYVTSKGEVLRMGKQRYDLVDLIVNEGRTLKQAAELIGIAYTSALRALRDPKVRTLRQDMLSGLRTAAQVRAWNKLDQLVDADEDKVALGAANSVLDRTEGKAVQKVQMQATHTHTHRVVVDVSEPTEALQLHQANGVYSLPDDTEDDESE